MSVIKGFFFVLVALLVAGIGVAIVTNMLLIAFEVWYAIVNGNPIPDEKITNLFLAGIMITVASLNKKD